MSAAPASVRPAAMAPPPVAAPPSPAVLEARARSRERARRTFTAAYFVAMAIPPAAVLAGPAIGGGWVMVSLIFCYGLVMPSAGLVILGFAAFRRTPRELRALLATVPALAASIALIPVAGTAAREMALDRNVAEMEAIVAEIERGGPALRREVGRASWDRSNPAPAEIEEAAARLRERVRAAGFTWVSAGDGHVLFHGGAQLAPALLYMTGEEMPHTLEDCDPRDARYAGGRWYMLKCTFEHTD